jgi:hypothetical protein
MAGTLAVSIEVSSAPARLTDGELRLLALWNLSFRPWQRGAYQPPMHRTVIIPAGGDWFFAGF